MSIPLTSSRIQFHHGKPRSSLVHERPPRYPSQSSNRSRSLELLDDKSDEINKLLVTESTVVPARPHSKSLDELLTDDELCEQVIRSNSHCQDDKNSRLLSEKIEISSDKSNKDSEIELENVQKTLETNKNIEELLFKNLAEKKKDKIKENTSCPMPIPRLKSRTNRLDSSTKTEQFNNQRISLHSLNSSSSHCDKSTSSSNENSLKIITTNPRILVKTRSCETGLDDNKSTSSCASDNVGSSQPRLTNNNNNNNEPKKNHNFMNKCVKKMKSLINK